MKTVLQIDTTFEQNLSMVKQLPIQQKLKLSKELEREIIVTTDQFLTEVKFATGREKLKKYFPKENVIEQIELLDKISENVEIQPKYFINRDLKGQN